MEPWATNDAPLPRLPQRCPLQWLGPPVAPRTRDMLRSLRRPEVFRLVVIGVCALIVSVQYDLFESFAPWSRKYLQYDVDELVMLIVTGALAMSVLARRRHLGGLRELRTLGNSQQQPEFQAEAHRANEAKPLSPTDVSHEIQTSDNSLIEMNEWLSDTAGSSSKQSVGAGSWFGSTPPSVRNRTAAPATQADQDLPGVGAAHPHLARATPPLGLVLVAEDNASNQLMARGVLEGLGYQVKFAWNGLEAVAAMSAGTDSFAAVLMDCRMPRLDGLEATRVIRKLEQPGTRVPIIAMTASALLGERERCLAAGMDDFLVKPIDFELLESTLAHWVRGADPDAARADAVDATGVLDLARIRVLHELRAGDHSFFIQCLDSFSARVPEDTAAIESAVRDTDHPRLVSAAHALKGSALNLGAAELARLCHALEHAGQRLDTAEARALVDSLAERAEIALVALGDRAASALKDGQTHAER